MDEVKRTIAEAQLNSAHNPRARDCITDAMMHYKQGHYGLAHAFAILAIGLAGSERIKLDVEDSGTT